MPDEEEGRRLFGDRCLGRSKGLLRLLRRFVSDEEKGQRCSGDFG
jgi:hypothetical protein